MLGLQGQKRCWIARWRCGVDWGPGSCRGLHVDLLTVIDRSERDEISSMEM